MKSNSFPLLLVAILALGGGLGGAFFGGMALGKSQEAEAAQNGQQTVQIPSPSTQSSNGSSDASLDEIRQRIQSGSASQEDLAELRRQIQGSGGGGGQGFGGGGQGLGGGRGFAGRGGLTGTIEGIDGSTLTVNTPQGPLLTTLGEDTVIQMFATGTLGDLLEGIRVTVTGERGEDGNVQARSILLIPEGADNLFGGGGFFGDSQQRDRQPQ